MIYVVIILLTVVPTIIIFAFLMAILNSQRRSVKGNIVTKLKVLKILELSVHIKTERATPNKRKGK